MKQRMMNKITSLLLAILLFINAFPSSAVLAESNDFVSTHGVNVHPLSEEVDSTIDVEQSLSIIHDGTEISELVILKHEKVEISAYGLDMNAEYQWQVLHPEDNSLWVNIYDATGSTLNVTLALVQEVLSDDNSALLRCIAKSGEKEFVSEPLEVFVMEESNMASLFALDNREDEIMAIDDVDSPANHEFVTITVKYLRYDYLKNSDGDYKLSEEGVDVFTPYIATILYNGKLSTTVKFPTIAGYRSYVDNGVDTDTDTQLVLDEVNVTNNKEYIVKYVPDNVKYVVHYFFQNIYDDNYVEDAGKTIVSSGLTGNEPAPEHVGAQFAGFTPMYYQPDVIAADGSTVFEVYYERNYYLMDFDCAGGYGADPVYVRYGTYVSVPSPVRSGWNFGGWDLYSTDESGMDVEVSDGNKDTLPETMPHYNSQYKAIWTKEPTTFTVIYWLQNANDEGYSYVHSFSEVHAITGDIITKDNVSQDPIKYKDDYGNEYNVPVQLSDSWFTEHERDVVRHCKLNEEMTKSVTLEGDGSSVFNIYFDRVQYSLKFYYAMSFDNAGTETYLIVGGSTHYFGGQGGSYNTEESLFDRYYYGDLAAERGFTSQKPTLNALGNSRNYIKSYDTYNQRNLHYIAFTAKYGADLSNLWPCGIFNPVEMQSGQDSTLWDGKEALVSAWNGEYRVKYTRDSSVNGGNQTVKGNYERLDENLLWWKAKDQSTYADINDNDINNDGENENTGGTVAFLCFWENGAPKNWNVPELYIYNYWMECLDQDNPPEGYWEKDGIKYEYLKSVYTSDDSSIGEQTIPSVSGYYTPTNASGIKLTEWSAIFIGSTQKNSAGNYWVQDQHSSIRYNPTTKEVSNGWTRTQEMSIMTLDNGDFLLYDDKDVPTINRYVYNPNNPGNPDDPDDPINNINHNLYREAYSREYFFRRNEYMLNFDNYGTSIKKEVDVKYGELIKDLFPPTPSYPSTLEPNAYEFRGWYTGPKGSGLKILFDDGEERIIYDDGDNRGDSSDGVWYNPTMPYENLNIFAYWAPVVHRVYFYKDYNDYVNEVPWIHQNDLGNLIIYPLHIPHGSLLETAHYSNPTKEGYKFIGWFYLDDNGKKRFAPESMEIKKPLKLFGEWISDAGIATTYDVSYVYNDGSKIIEIGDRTLGYSTVGKTKTFNAKGNADLKPEYQTKYFPQIASHSILMEEMDSNGTTPNVFQFTYVYDELVWYKIRYVDIATNTEITGYGPKILSTDHAVITERYYPIPGYVPMPGYYYQTKSLKSDGEATGGEVLPENVITFYYMKDTEHSAYSIEYYLEDEKGTWLYDGKTYSQKTMISNTADLLVDGNLNVIDSNEEFSVLSFDGYKFTKAAVSNFSIVDDKLIETVTKTFDVPPISGTLDENGLTIRLYYQKLKFPYTIKYVEYGNTSNVLYSETHENIPFGAEVSHLAPASYKKSDTAYSFYIDNSTELQRTLSLTIRTPVSDDPDTAVDETYNNELIFYYKQKQVNVIYHAICLTDGAIGYGTVSLNSEMSATVDGLSGSVAQPGEGYKLVGWFTKDGENYNEVNSSWLLDPDLTDDDEAKSQLKPLELNTDLDEIHYYAIFEPITTSMTIHHKFTDDDYVTADSFLFRIKGNGKVSFIDVTVKITGKNSVTISNLPVGEYTITELTDWSWKYEQTDVHPTDGIVNAQQTTTNSVTFIDQYIDPTYWLHDESSKDNVFSH